MRLVYIAGPYAAPTHDALACPVCAAAGLWSSLAPHPGDPEARVVVQARVAEAVRVDADVERLSGLYSELSTTPATVEQFISRLTPWAEIEQLCELSTTPIGIPDSVRGGW